MNQQLRQESLAINCFDLPPSVREVAEVIGRHKALYLIGNHLQCGKRRRRRVLWVPTQIKPDHDLVRLIGWHDAQKLSRHFGGEILQLSSCQKLIRDFRNKAVLQMRKDGLNKHIIAQRFNLSWRQINNIWSNEIPPEEKIS